MGSTIVKGTVADIRFRNEENGYTIATIETDNDVVVVVGIFPPVGEGSYVSAEGTFVEHARFGRQLKADSVKLDRPDTLYGMIRFLGSGLIRGVGEKRAAAIVEKFGARTAEIIEREPERLHEVSGISKRLAKEIAESYGEVKAASDALSFLMEFGVTSNLAMKIYLTYGKDTEALVRTDPYRLTEDVRGVGFLTADRIARSMGVPPDSDFRLRAGVAHVLTESAEKSGNTFMPREQLVESAEQLLGEENCARLDDAIDALLLSTRPSALREVAFEGGQAVMLRYLYRAEKSAADKLCRMSDRANRSMPDCADEIAEFERIEGVTFHHEQKKAIASALGGGVSVITGGPGTGKTTIVRCILRLLTAHGKTVRLMAPTGRAAKRLGESTGQEASTIHRALLSDECADGILEDAVIVDEFSMVDVQLLSSLLSKLRDESTLVIVGDADQLPSVGAGNALADIIGSGRFPVTFLTHIYRQGEGSGITVAAHRINAGELPDLKNAGGDFFFIRAADAHSAAQTVRDLVTRRLPGYLGCEPTKLQVLCPVKNGEAGCVNLNTVLRDALLPERGREVAVGDTRFAAGDKVMHVVNNYDIEWSRGTEKGTGVFNGDMGTVLEALPDSGEIIVEFEDGRTVTYSGEDKFQLMLAYAITVHKSQGSEYEGVVIPLVGGNYMIMTRNLLYTAVTRAKRLAVIVGTEETVSRTVRNNFIRKRWSMLGDFILKAESDMVDLMSAGAEDGEKNV